MEIFAGCVAKLERRLLPFIIERHSTAVVAAAARSHRLRERLFA